MAEDPKRRRLQNPANEEDFPYPAFEVGRDNLCAPQNIPLQLMCSAFGHFCDLNCASSDLPPADCLQWAQQLCDAVRPYYNDESLLAEKGLAVFNKLMRSVAGFPNILPTFHGTGTGNKSDPVDDGQATYLLQVAGNYQISLASMRIAFKLPNNPADPLIQVLGYQFVDYNKIVTFLRDKATKADKRRLLRCYPFPLLGVTVTDVDVQVFGAVITGTYADPVSVRSQHLSHKVSFVAPRHSDAGWVELARLLHALREAAAKVHEHYTAFYNAPLTPATSGALDQLPEYPLPYNLRSLVLNPTFTAKEKLLWRGASTKSDGNVQSVVVKYAERYNAAVHQSWASAELAPELVDTQHLSGGYVTVIMQDLSALGYRMVSDLDHAERMQAKELALQALDRVPPGTVHGDLREDNALLGPKEPSGSRKVKFVDFEWAGMQGQVKYPYTINMALFHNGAAPGGCILQQHDKDMVASWGQDRS